MLFKNILELPPNSKNAIEHFFWYGNFTLLKDVSITRLNTQQYITFENIMFLPLKYPMLKTKHFNVWNIHNFCIYHSKDYLIIFHNKPVFKLSTSPVCKPPFQYMEYTFIFGIKKFSYGISYYVSSKRFYQLKTIFNPKY